MIPFLPDPARLASAVPWPQMAYFCIPSLLLGLSIGFVWGRASKSPTGDVMRPLVNRSRETYDRWAPLLFAAIAILALIGIWIGTASTITNGRQDAQRASENEARDKQTRELLKCFDQYAQAASSASSAVREAQVTVDKATSIRDDALAAEGDAFYAVVKKILAHTATADDFQRLADTLELRSQMSKDLDRAQTALDNARRENPVPPAPSSFCGTSRLP